MSDDGFKPIRPIDNAVDDLALLPGHVRMLTNEMRDGFAMIADKLLPMVERLEQKFDALVDRVERIDQRQRDFQRATDDRFAAIEARLPKPRKKKVP